MKQLVLIVLITSCCVAAYIECDYPSETITPDLNIHFQSSFDLSNWITFSVINNIQVSNNKVFIGNLTQDYIFYRVFASNNNGISLTNNP